MSESTQIVRKQKRGEPLPPYSTAHLLMHVPVDAPAYFSPQQFGEKSQLFNRNRQLIKKMLGQFATNREIGDAVGLPERYIERYLSLSYDMTDLCKARRANTCVKASSAISRLSKDRFREKKNEILLALKTDGIKKVAKQFGFATLTLKRFLDEEPK
ncbi:hypothetical protein [Nitrosospira briensis]|uniref:hypothetical protein n=1 Tax=Nitrosospira briensis TaxID=35799 RepID=UPI0004698386|nr:hypothetical protein [Nitrosospira briensis]